MRALLDTNVLASDLMGLTQRSKTASPIVLSLWDQGAFELLCSDFVLGELETVLQRPYFARHITPEDRHRILQTLRTDAEIVSLQIVVIGIAKHGEDDLVLSAAVSGNADFLVTGDSDFLRVHEHQGVKIITPADFLRQLDAVTEPGSPS